MARRVVEWKYRYLPAGVRCWISREGYTLLWSARNGITYRGRSVGYCWTVTDADSRHIFNTIWESAIKRKTASNGQAYSSHGSDAWLSENFPSLHEFLTAGTFDDEKDRREAPTITFWAQGGQWKCSVRDRAEGLVLWLSGPDLKELMQMLELFVLDDSAPWRHDEAQHPRDKKRVERK